MPLPRRSTTPPDDRAIGRRLQELRKRRGFSQAEIASTLGLSQPRVSQYERGEVRLSAPLAAALAKTLRVSADEILGLQRMEEDDLLKDRRFLRRIQRIDKLSRRDKQALLKNLDMFLKGAGIS